MGSYTDKMRICVYQHTQTHQMSNSSAHGTSGHFKLKTRER